MTRRRSLAAVLALAALALPAQATAAVRTGPAGDAFYTPPKTLPGKTHGDPIWVRRLTGEQTLAEAKLNQLILYRSTSIRGKAVAVSGTVHLPKGRAPSGGWPVVSWAHATTGLGDQCAPSRNPGEGAVHAYSVYIEPLLDRWLKAGFAVVRTDYEGLGTKGVHPYLVGASEGRGVLDIVRAARKTHPGLLSTRFAVGGHSQGGHAGVFAAALAPKWTPELRLRGTAALAPFAQGDEIFAAIAGLDQPSRLSGYVAVITRGLTGAYPQLDAKAVLSDRGLELFPLTLSQCIPEITAGDSPFAQTAPRDMLRQGADLTTPTQLLAANDPTELSVASPLLVEQGNADATVLPNFTAAMVEGLRKRGAKVTLKLHDGIDHTTVAFGEPQDETFSWVSKRLR